MRTHPIIPTADRFWSKVSISKDDSHCWTWTGGTCKGYGTFRGPRPEYRLMRANRMAYILEHGEIPKGMIVRHTCDNPACVNPKHLILGTHKDNTRDMFERGRARNQFSGSPAS